MSKKYMGSDKGLIKLIELIKNLYDKHTHVISNVDGLQSALDGKAALSHEHDSRYYTESEIDTKLNSKLNTSLKGSASGLAELDSNGKVPSAQLPSFVDDVIEGYLYNGKFYKESAHTTVITGESGKIYIDLATEKTYRWSGSAFAIISDTLALGETSTTAYRGDRGKTAYDHSQATHARTDATKVEKSSTNGNIKINGTETTVYTHPSGTNPHGTTKSDVGLGNVGNFKAVSTVASQGLTDTEKSNARANIGAGTSSFSGSYNDLSNKPSIPSVGNGTITIKQAGTTKGSFTTNQSGNTTIELTDNNTTYSSKSAASGGTDVSLVTTGEKYTWNNKSDLKLGTTSTTAAAGNHTHSSYVNQNAFSNVVVGSTTVTADSATDTLTFVAGSNVTITPDATNDKITIAATDTNTWRPLGTTADTACAGNDPRLSNSRPANGGTATYANILNVNNSEDKTVGRLQFFQKSSDNTINPDTGWWSVLRTQHPGYTNGYWQEIAFPFTSGGRPQVRQNVNGTKSGWKELAYKSDIPTSLPANGGTSASCTGNSATATALTTSAGSATQPVYFKDGKPVACTYTLGKSVPSNAVFTDTTYSAATTSANGLMTSAMVTKLNGITDSADSVSFSRNLTTGTKVGTITINGTGTDLYAPTNTDTHYTTGLIVGDSSDAIFDRQATNGRVYLNLLDDLTIRDSHKIVGSGATIVTSDNSGNITISSTDTNTWRPVQNNLTSTSTTDSLSAYQGKLLKDSIDTLNSKLFKHTDITVEITIGTNNHLDVEIQDKINNIDNIMVIFPIHTLYPAWIHINVGYSKEYGHTGFFLGCYNTYSASLTENILLRVIHY